ncbi:hypothetical protein JCM18750_36120 [Halostagnicola bangensis]
MNLSLIAIRFAGLSIVFVTDPYARLQVSVTKGNIHALGTRTLRYDGSLSGICRSPR